MAFEQNLFRVDSTILNVLLRGCYRFSVFRKLKKKIFIRSRCQLNFCHLHRFLHQHVILEINLWNGLGMAIDYDSLP